MDITQAILCMISTFFLGAAICLFVLWLIFVEIPKMHYLKEDKFEKRVKEVIKRNYDKPMNVTKEYIKDLIKEVKNEQEKQ